MLKLVNSPFTRRGSFFAKHRCGVLGLIGTHADHKRQQKQEALKRMPLKRATNNDAVNRWYRSIKGFFC